MVRMFLLVLASRISWIRQGQDKDAPAGVSKEAILGNDSDTPANADEQYKHWDVPAVSGEENTLVKDNKAITRKHHLVVLRRTSWAITIPKGKDNKDAPVGTKEGAPAGV